MHLPSPVSLSLSLSLSLSISISLLTLTLPLPTTAHTIFQAVSIAGSNQGQLSGVRSPSTNNPVYDVSSADIICNTGLSQPVSSTVLSVASGQQVGALFGHVLGGAQVPGDKDNPIAASHKGPISVYLAKVGNAASAGADSSLNWFKVYADGLDTGSGLWAVDRMIAAGGWTYFTLPTCIAPGNYLMRVELIALHSAYASKGAQFYGACAQINVVGTSGAKSPSTVKFPGAYAQNDAGVLINIYGSSGLPDNNRKPYPIPGPAVFTC